MGPDIGITQLIILTGKTPNIGRYGAITDCTNIIQSKTIYYQKIYKNYLLEGTGVLI